MEDRNGVKSVVLIPVWTNHPLSQLVRWCRVTGAVLPVRWACPRTPAPAPAGPLHTGQSDSQPGWHSINLSIFRWSKHDCSRLQSFSPTWNHTTTFGIFPGCTINRNYAGKLCTFPSCPVHMCNVTGLVLLLMPVEILLGLLDPVAGQQTLVRGTRRETIEMRMPTNRAPLCWASVVLNGLIQPTESTYRRLGCFISFRAGTNVIKCYNNNG